MARKPKSNAKLKNLLPKTQEAIWKMLTEVNAQGVQPSYENVAKQLRAEWDISVSETTLREFWIWYPTQFRLRDSASFADTLREEIAKLPNLKLDDEQISAIGQAAFELEAIRNKDPETFIALQRVKLERQGMKGRAEVEHAKLGQGDRRLKLQEAKARAFDEAKGVFENKELTEEQRTQMMREKFAL